MVALGLEFAKNLAIVVAIAFGISAIVSIWAVKNITSKLLAILILGGIALGAWTQRRNLESCADQVRARVEVGDTGELTCTFFGTDVKVPSANS